MANSHGIGVKRNDYHRRNRRRNISTHSRSAGTNTEIRFLGHVRLIKGGGLLTRQHVEEFNEREDNALYSDAEREGHNERDEIPVFFKALSAMDQSRFMYLPPFLKSEQIKQRRFGPDANDRWWDWEEELGLTSDDGRPVDADHLEMKQPLRW